MGKGKKKTPFQILPGHQQSLENISVVTQGGKEEIMGCKLSFVLLFLLL